MLNLLPKLELVPIMMYFVMLAKERRPSFTPSFNYVTQKIAHDVGLGADRVLTGNQVDTTDDAALAHQAEPDAIFPRMPPEQKNRMILALKARGHVVG